MHNQICELKHERWRGRHSARTMTTLDCPICDTPLPLIKPSANGRGKRYAGAWCMNCRRAWRAFIPERGAGWRIIWDIGAGEREYVLNGHLANEANDG